MMSIADFAERTGISASALRFYERKGLLVPADRLSNGYRAYSRTQLKDAQLVHSLRQAAIGLAGIRTYLAAGREERLLLLEAWRREADARLLEAEIARSYLHALRPEMPPISLHRWHEPSVICWLAADAPRKAMPFRAAIAAGRRLLVQSGIDVLESGYVRSIDLEPDRIVGEVGFRLEPGKRWKLPAGARVQHVQPQLLVAMDCAIEQEKAAHRLFGVLADFGFAPTGVHFERYLPRESASYRVIVGIRRT